MRLFPGEQRPADETYSSPDKNLAAAFECASRQGGRSPSGMIITMLAREAHETFDVPPELEAELLESIAQAERGETLSADDVLRRLRRTS